MDGTLWDAVDTYALAWNKGLRHRGVDKAINRQSFFEIMGWEKQKALDYLLPDIEPEERENIYESVITFQDKLIPAHGGLLYEGVHEGIKILAKHYRLFVVSNCAKDTIRQFLHWSGLADFVTDEMAHGANARPKHYNIRHLINKHGLISPVYVGDTEGDQLQSELANIPFVFVRYGFGTAQKFDLSFDSFKDLTQYFVGTH